MPAGWSAPADERGRFANQFCSLLPASYQPCDNWLTLPESFTPNSQPSSADDPLDTGYLVIAVGGIFSDCLNGVVTTLQDALEHLKSLHFETDHWRTSANSSSTQNGKEIATRLRALPAGTRVIAVGHSKGAVDLIEAVAQDPQIQDVLKAVITINSPVSGARLADSVPNWLKDLSKRIDRLGTCDLGSGEGVNSLEPSTRQMFWSVHPDVPKRVRFYSLVSVSAREKTSPVFRPLWDSLSRYSLDQDSQVTADEGVVPGGTYLGRLKGDHWAAALPIELVDTKAVRALFGDYNHFPRSAMLEAAVRIVVEDQTTLRSKVGSVMNQETRNRRWRALSPTPYWP